MLRKDIVIPSGAMALALCVFSAQADDLKATQYGDFDRYVLALSWQTGFCQSMVGLSLVKTDLSTPLHVELQVMQAACAGTVLSVEDDALME